MAAMLFRTFSSNFFLVYSCRATKTSYAFEQNLGTMLNATNKKTF